MRVPRIWPRRTPGSGPRAEEQARADDGPASPPTTPRMVLGTGTGRCGTLSLGLLFDLQPGAAGRHEALEYQLPARGGDGPAHYRALVEMARAVRPVVDLFFDANLVYLWYAEELLRTDPGLTMLCLERDRAGMVASFLRKAGPRNHWTEHDGTAYLSDPWDRCFPKYPASTREEALGMYWDACAERARRLASLHPGRFRVFPMTDLNSEEGQQGLLAFAGIPAPRQVLRRGLQANRSHPPA